MGVRLAALLVAVTPLLFGAGCTTSTFTSSENKDSGDATSSQVTFVDMHVHIYPTTEEENAQYIDDLVAAAAKNGVSQIVLGLHARHEPERPPIYSTQHDEWVLEAAERYPGVIIPSLNGFDPADPDAVDYVEDQLTTGDWKMIGELDLRNKPKKTSTPANTDTLMAIYALAAEYQVPVMLHVDFDYGTTVAAATAELEDALAQNPNTNFIYAHSCGMNVAAVMAKYDNLYCEQQSSPITSGIDMDRVVLGTDMQVHGQRPENAAKEYAALITKVKNAISGWDDDDQNRATAETAAKLLGLD